ncbi:glycosyltransferase [Microbacterium sp. GXF7504]
MIGYYIHHHGRGHLDRALAIAAASATPVTGLSSLPRPDDWAGPWIDLPMDDGDAAADADAHGLLHWVPVGSVGLAARMAAVTAWIVSARPTAMVVDVSVEIAVQARLLGVPVVTMALPGTRTDPAHALGYGLSAAIIAAWPPGAAGCLHGMPDAAAARLHPVGAISRFPPFAATAPEPRHVLVFAGSGGDGLTPGVVDAARSATPHWTWLHIGGGSGAWLDDPREALAAASVVVTTAGQGALAEVAAARRPAVVLPQERPFGEQAASARVLADGPWPVVVRDRLPAPGGWEPLLDEAAALDGRRWDGWNDGDGAARAAEIIHRVATGGLR